MGTPSWLIYSTARSLRNAIPIEGYLTLILDRFLLVREKRTSYKKYGMGFVWLVH
jgi:hypothetical protein